MRKASLVFSAIVASIDWFYKVDRVLKDGTINHAPRAVSDAECSCDNLNEYKCVAKTSIPVCGVARAETKNIIHSKWEGFQVSGGMLSRRKQQKLRHIN